MTKILSAVHGVVWGAPALLAILGVGVYLCARLSFAPLLLLPRALRSFFQRLRPGGGGGDGISSIQALCTALAATVGTGNLVGVAGAICLGGPGAIFWMWVCGLLGMGIKFAEVLLAVSYRVRTEDGYAGGPMYVITQGMGQRFTGLARLYCLFGVIAAFGVGNAAQINAAVAGINQIRAFFGGGESLFGNLLIGVCLAALIGTMLFGGAKKIGQAAQLLVPFAACAYLLLCTGVLIRRREALPEAFAMILKGAFCPRAVTGGMLGSAVQVLRVGCSRGVFTNEAGMGTAAIAHASAQVRHPAEQGLMGIVEVFLDTIVMCTLTALAVLVSGVPIPYGRDMGATLTTDVFGAVYGPLANAIVGLILLLLAVATVLGWGLYGARCAQFLFGSGAWRWFAAAQTAAVAVSAVLDTASVWLLCETVNGLMAIPNLITLAALAPQAARLTEEYRNRGSQRANGGYYADIHQCEPVRAVSYAEIPPTGGGGGKGRKEDLPSEHRSTGSSHAKGILPGGKRLFGEDPGL